MLKLFLLGCVLLLASGQAVQAQNKKLDALIPRQTQPLLDKAQKLINMRHLLTITKQANHEFVEILQQIGQQIDASSAQEISDFQGTDIRAKLIAIAWDERTHPQIYRELEQEYVWLVLHPGAHVLIAHTLEDKHAVEFYRLAWEYLLLSPVFSSGVGGYTLRAEEALERIKNNDSILTLVQLFGTTTVEGTSEELTSEDAAVSTLTHFDNTAGLQGLLTCLSLAEDKRQKHPVQASETFKLRDRIYQWLSSGGTPERIDNWNKLISAHSREGLSHTQKALLDSIAPATQSQPKVER